MFEFDRPIHISPIQPPTRFIPSPPSRPNAARRTADLSSGAELERNFSSSAPELFQVPLHSAAAVAMPVSSQVPLHAALHGAAALRRRSFLQTLEIWRCGGLPFLHPSQRGAGVGRGATSAAYSGLSAKLTSNQLKRESIPST